MPVSPHRILPIKPTRISKSGQSCLRVLSLLLTQDLDHLVDRFYEAKIYDHCLTRIENYQDLREKLVGVVRPAEVETIIVDFDRERWKWCPLTLCLDMDANLHGTKVIPPFCLKTKISEKEGTASIYWVAVQKDLISDNALALALQDSIYTDDDFGECYQMVLKSYCGNKQREFELEKGALSDLQSNDQIPILKYLGSYTHDYGEGKGFGKTYNLLLEYGENDLYQTWMDETNVPPVQAQEILQNWRSIFDIATAIRHVHHLEIRRGKGQPWRFHGWHADIKPDNILSVRGRLKLADFGSSSFAPVIEGHNGPVPNNIESLFTDTYVAPEVSRMEQPNETLSGVSQAIDAWSFGCILSSAATWIVLGPQGLDQYKRFRQLALGNNKDGAALDCFHNGSDVLPEVKKWHDYLRGHLRLSDTTTKLVLDLIEHKLLRADPAVRHTMGDLCVKLEELSNAAERRIQTLPKLSSDIDPVTTMALYKIEEEAQFQRWSESKDKLSQPFFPRVNPRERASMQINKDELMRNKPRGQTAHRKQILEIKILENQEISESVYHGGATTESPIDDTSLTQLRFPDRKIDSNISRLERPVPRPFVFTGPDATPLQPPVTPFRVISEAHEDLRENVFDKRPDLEQLQPELKMETIWWNRPDRRMDASSIAPKTEFDEEAPSPSDAPPFESSEGPSNLEEQDTWEEQSNWEKRSEWEEQSNWEEQSDREEFLIVGDTLSKSNDEGANDDCEVTSVRSECSERSVAAQGIFQLSPSFDYQDRVLPLWKRIMKAMKCLVRPPVPKGYARLEWTCECGEEMYGDYSNDDPIALNFFAASLQDPTSSREQRLPISEVIESEDTRLSGQVSASNDCSGRAGPAQSQSGVASAGSSMPSTSIQLRPTGAGVVGSSSSLSQTAAGHSSVTTSPLGGGKKTYFELCVNTGIHNVNLGEINLEDVSTDAKLFNRIYQEYKRIRGHRIRRIFVRPADIHFVLFSVEERHRVGIYEKPFAIPPEDEVRENRYDYKECPLKVKPPIDHRTFFHYMNKHKEYKDGSANVHSTAKYLQRLPKKIGQSIHDTKSELSFGWGVHIIEGPDKTAISIAILLIVVVSFLVSVLYCLIAETEEQGFGIGQFLLAAFFPAFSTVLFHSLET
ncbi:unnamed protein product [Alternaria alternata]